MGMLFPIFPVVAKDLGINLSDNLSWRLHLFIKLLPL